MAVARALILAAAALATLPALASAAPADSARFAVTYSGSGSWRTVYRSQPPNPGGNPDHDAANDASTQRWRLAFAAPVALGRPRPLSGARGRIVMTARIAHSHVDGLFPADDGSISCGLSFATAADARLAATILIRYRAHGRAIEVTALNPVTDALDDLSTECPNQGDALDGLADDYSTPGFSFAPGFGPARWFTSATVAIPLAQLQRAERIRLRLSNTRAGAAPAGCAVPAPAYEQCSTGGSWAGVLTFSRR